MDRGRGTVVPKSVVVASCAAVFLGCAVYVYFEVSKALEEPTEKERIAARLVPEERGYFDRLKSPFFAAIFPPPESACGPAARPHVDRAVTAAMRAEIEATIAAAEAALAVDPDCVSAANLLIHAHGKRGTQLLLRERLKGRADANLDNAAAQLAMALYFTESGGGDQLRRYLERASAARENQPLLHQVWGYYYVRVADPLDYGRAIGHFLREVDGTGAVVSMNWLVHLYHVIGDLERTKLWCDRYFAAFPASTLEEPTYHCLKAVLDTNDRAAESVYRERFWKADGLVPPCRHGALAEMLLPIPDRLDEAMEEAGKAVELGCSDWGAWPRIRGLLLQGRYDEAATAARAASLRSNYDRFVRALALALVGDRAGAESTADGTTRTVIGAGPVGKEPNLGNLRILRELVVQGAPHSALERLARGESAPDDWRGEAACGYIARAMFDEGRRALERALEADAKSPAAWRCKAWLHTIDEQPAQAVADGERALALGVRDGGLENNIGYAYELMERCDRAIGHFESALALSPLLKTAYGNLASCLSEVGRDDEAARVRRFVLEPTAETVVWWYFALVVVGAIGLYLGAKLMLIRLLPERFGHLRFP